MSTRKNETRGTPQESRRGFLRGMGVAGATAAAAVAAPIGTAQATESRDEQRKARYRETEHVKRFYQTNRY
jgi:hypothetical protein